MTAVAQAAAAVLTGAAVATTIATRIVRPESASPRAVVAALIAAILWSALTWRSGLPSSSSHALMAGLVGAAVAWAARGPFSFQVSSESSPRWWSRRLSGC